MQNRLGGFVDVPTRARTHAVCHKGLGVPVNAFAIAGRSLRLGEDGGGDAADAVGVCDAVELDDLAVDDDEGHGGERPPQTG